MSTTAEHGARFDLVKPSVVELAGEPTSNGTMTACRRGSVAELFGRPDDLGDRS
jgi:hypothetical protein